MQQPSQCVIINSRVRSLATRDLVIPVSSSIPLVLPLFLRRRGVSAVLAPSASLWISRHTEFTDTQTCTCGSAFASSAFSANPFGASQRYRGGSVLERRGARPGSNFAVGRERIERLPKLLLDAGPKLDATESANWRRCRLRPIEGTQRTRLSRTVNRLSSVPFTYRSLCNLTTPTGRERKLAGNGQLERVAALRTGKSR